MKTQIHFLFIALALLSSFGISCPTAWAQGTAFTYQGRLNDGSAPANGSYDVTFALFATNASGVAIAGPVTNSATAVSNGLFTTMIDFGPGVFNGGTNLWLEIGVRTNGAGTFTNLVPRQQITAAPYAIFANTASNLSGTLPAAQLSGTVSSASISGTYGNAVTLNNAGNNFSGTFTGNGQGLSLLNASSLSTGTVPLARLSDITSNQLDATTWQLATNQSSGNLNGDVTGPQGATVVASVDGQTAANVAAGATAANAATSAATANTIVKRDGSGNFSAGAVTAGSFNGNGAGIINVDIGTLNSEGAFSFTTFDKNDTFSSMATIAVGEGPAWLATADINGDGLPDLITANSSDNTLTVLTNNGAGLFRLAGTVPVGSQPLGLATTSVRSNGKTDLICANHLDNTVMVLTNNGTGIFTLASTLSVGSGPTSVVALDVNGDGYPDIVVADSLTNKLSVLLNDQTGSFSAIAPLTVGYGPRQVAALYTTEQGYPQIFLATANQSDNTVTVLTNYSNGPFALMTTLTAGSSPSSVAIGDLNGDSYPDIVCANTGANTISLFLNNQANGFISFGTIAAGAGPALVAAADLNKDGLTELITANQYTNTLTVLSNNFGLFFPVQSPAVGNGPSCIAIADFNGDQVSDLAVANQSDNSVTILSGNRVASFNGNAATATKAVNVTGNISDAQLSANIPRLNGSASFSGTVIATNFQNASGSFIAGAGNTNGSSYAAIGGGLDNYIQNSSPHSTISGGWNNLIMGGAYDATIGGGFNNLIWPTAHGATINGGSASIIMGLAYNAVIGGGYDNTNSAQYGTIAGGLGNTVNVLIGNSIGGGVGNNVSGIGSTIPGGYNNVVNGNYSFAAGQQAQATNDGTFVWADSQNVPFASTISNQFLIRAQGGVGINTASTPENNFSINTNTYLFSHAIYLRGESGTDHNHGLAYNGNTVTNFGTGNVQVDGPVLWGFNGGALGTANGGQKAILTWNTSGVGIGTNNPAAKLQVTSNGGQSSPQLRLDQTTSGDFARLRMVGGSSGAMWDIAAGGGSPNTMNFFVSPTIGGTGTNILVLQPNGNATFFGTVTANGVLLTSDRNAKENFEPLNAQAVLAKIVALPMSEWNYKTDGKAVQHIGPMAQDFHAAFGLDGADDKHISVVDEGGVALAAIQGLNQKFDEKDAEIRTLKQQNDLLAQRLNGLEAAVKLLVQKK